MQAPPKSRYQDRVQSENDEDLSELDDEAESEDESQASAEDGDSEDDAEEDAAEGGSSEDESSDADDSSSENEAVLASLRESVLSGAQEKPARKRKRGDKEEIEDTYMQKLAREEVKEEEQRQKKRKMEKAQQESDEDSDEAGEESQPAVEDGFTVPKHESLTQTTDKSTEEVEKASRTVFLSNVSTECINSKSAEKALKKHLESFVPDLADNTPPHKVESIRFRSTAFDNSLPKRAAFAKKEIMDSTTRSTNAYAVYTTTVAAREAVKRLNGSILLKRHLHVDSVAHPAKIDNRRCVFVGNLPFVDDESQDKTPEGEAKKKKPASDIEEGLWTHFGKAGKIESVRVVRDGKTRVGKGFAYVQFYDENGVEAALQYHEQKYPPMLPRKLRVTRCRAEKKNKKDKPRVALPTKDKRAGGSGKAGYVAKMSDEQKSMQGRARSMLGKVAKAQAKEGFVFEGHRAKEGQGKSGLKFRGSGGKKKGPNGRTSRSSAWKKGGKK